MSRTKPDQSFWKLWNLSFGFFGVQIAYALQSANITRIFATIGADPHSLSYFWILPPLMGIIVQPLVGAASDRTWNRLGRRLPYLLIGAAVLVLCVIYSFVFIREMPPKEYAEYHGIKKEEQTGKKQGMLSLLRNAPRTFWTVGLVQFFCWSAFLYMWTYTNGAIADTVWGTTDTRSAEYQAAGNWVGVLFAVQAVGSVIWAVAIPMFKNHKVVYALSLVLGGLGFISTLFITDQHWLFLSFLLIGCAWAAMPFTILTNSLSGKNMGTYLGLFNGTICLPQICAAALGGVILPLVGGRQVNMLVLAGAFLVVGAFCVSLIKETYAEAKSTDNMLKEEI